jgi:hypothetical protein
MNMNFEKNSKIRTALILSILIGLVIATGTWAYSKNLFTSPPSNEALQDSKAEAMHIAGQVLTQVDPEYTLEAIILAENKPGELVWEIRYTSGCKTAGELWIGALDGEIKLFCDLRKREEAESSSEQPLSHEATLVKAVKKAEDLGFFIPSSSPDEVTLLEKKNKEKPELFFKWQKEMNGYKFHDDWVGVFVDAGKGEILGYRKNYYSLNPPSLEVKIEKSQAIKSAEKVAARNGFTLETEKAELLIVNPNYRWTEKFVKNPIETELAWTIPFTKPEGKGEIWVDSQEGTLLGGEETL